jgi:ubiquinone/menaquinone biosynthesis C-methylase UbiE
MERTRRQERERAYWNEHSQAEEYARWREFPFESWRTFRPIQRRALDYLGPIAGRHLLVCGVGPDAVLFARAGAEVWGFDISEEQVAAVQDLVDRFGLSDKVHLQAMPFEAMDYPSSSFDAAFGDAILHHIDLSAGGVELARVLRSGARASFIEPLGTNPLLGFARRHVPYGGKGRTEDERPLNYHNVRSFSRPFASSAYHEYALLGMARRITRRRSLIRSLEAVDEVLLEHARWMRPLCQSIWIGVEAA